MLRGLIIFLVGAGLGAAAGIVEVDLPLVLAGAFASIDLQAGISTMRLSNMAILIGICPPTDITKTFTLIADVIEPLRLRPSADRRKRDCDLLASRRTALRPLYRPTESARARHQERPRSRC